MIVDSVSVPVVAVPTASNPKRSYRRRLPGDVASRDAILTVLASMMPRRCSSSAEPTPFPRARGLEAMSCRYQCGAVGRYTSTARVWAMPRPPGIRLAMRCVARLTACQIAAGRESLRGASQSSAPTSCPSSSAKSVSRGWR